VACPGWPFDAAEAVRRQKAAGPATERKIMLGNGSGAALDMVLVPAGEFVMGDPAGAADERATARVRIEKPFWISRDEISGAAYHLFRQADPSADPPVREQALGPVIGVLPAVRVSWDHAAAFCRWVSKSTGEECRLPTEAEWEWACRAGSAGALGSGIPDLKPDPKKHFGLTPCGAGPVNAWGVRNLHGNAAEWTLSLYRPYPYADADGRNDRTVTGLRVVRGGSFHDGPKETSSSYRWRYWQWQRLPNVGFRVVIDAEQMEK